MDQCYHGSMIIRKAFKYALRPKPAQERAFARFAGACRFVWNRALSIQKQRLGRGENILRYDKVAPLLLAWKQEKETAWLESDAYSQSLQQTLRDLDRALMDAFSKSSPKRFPRFKKRGWYVDSFRIPQHFRIDEANSRIKVPKIGWVRYRNSRKIEGVAKNITISRRDDRWFVSIQTEMEVAAPRHPSTSKVGIDMGVKTFAALSDGTTVSPLSIFKPLEKKLARAQKSLSRKQKFSSNWKKQKAKISAIHRKIANVRNDFLHKNSTAIAENHGVVVLEDLRVKNMSASAKGTIERPGRNVKVKSKFNKAILDQGWFEFRRQLEYKQSWRGGHVWTVPPSNTSRKCHACGHVSKYNRRSQERFQCVACGHDAHADLNAAKNILAAGLAEAANEK